MRDIRTPFIYALVAVTTVTVAVMGINAGYDQGGQITSAYLASNYYTQTQTLAQFYTETEIVNGYVPVTRTVNGKPLSANVSLAATDITAGAAGTMYYSNGTSLIALAPDNGKYLRSSTSGASWETVTSGLQAVASQATGDILYAADATTLARLPIDAGKYLKANAGGTGYEFATVSTATTWSKITTSQQATANQGYFLYVAAGGAELDLETPHSPTIGQFIQVCILYNGAATSMWLYSDDKINASTDDLELDTAPPNANYTFRYVDAEWGWVRTE